MISVTYDNQYVLDELVTSIRWSGDIAQAFRRLEVSIKNTLNGEVIALPIEVGHELRLMDDGAELFRGVVFNTSINARGDMTVTAYDENVYLTKNVDTRRFAKAKASTIIRELCTTYEIPAGNIADTGYVIPSVIFRNKSLWEMMITALTMTRDHNGRRFYLYSSEGALHLQERKDRVATLLLTAGQNILTANYTQSIDEMRTRVKVIAENSGSDAITVTLANAQLAERYGVMQHLEYATSDRTRSQVEQLARQLLSDLGTITDTATIDALGNFEVTAGSAVYVREPMTGIMGAYYVSTDEHTIENGVHRMYLTLSATDDLPAMEVDE